MRSILAILCICFLSLSAPVQAMSCRVNLGEREYIRQSYASATDVFSAYVEEHYESSAFGLEKVRLAKLRVLQVWKGALKPGDLTVGSAEESVQFIGDGFVPSLHSAVLVYGYGPPPFKLHACSRTTSLDHATRDIPLLNKLSARRDYKLGR